jgi:hypothetical protein
MCTLADPDDPQTAMPGSAAVHIIGPSLEISSTPRRIAGKRAKLTSALAAKRLVGIKLRSTGGADPANSRRERHGLANPQF